MIVYVDLENVNEKGLTGLHFLNENDILYIFYSCQVPRLKKEYWDISNEKNLTIRTKKLYKTVKNGLDFYIASQLGADTILYPEEEFAIISEDNDFEGIKDYWARVASKKHKVFLAPNIKEALKCSPNKRGDYVRSTEVLLPVESMERTSVSKDNIEELLEMAEEKGLRFTYNYCLRTFKKEGVSIYRRLKGILSEQSELSKSEEDNEVMEETPVCEETEECSGVQEEEESSGEETEEISDFMPISPLPVLEQGTSPQDFSMYGLIESMAIAERIIEEGNGTPIKDVAAFLTKTGDFAKGPHFGDYYGIFQGIKVSDIIMDIKRFAASGAFTVTNEIIDNIDESILNEFASPTPNSFFEKKSFDEYRDIDWIYLMQSGNILSAKEWKGVLPMLDRLCFITAKKDDIATFLRRANKETLSKIKKLKGRSSNGKKATLQYILQHVS